MITLNDLPHADILKKNFPACFVQNSEIAYITIWGVGNYLTIYSMYSNTGKLLPGNITLNIHKGAVIRSEPIIHISKIFEDILEFIESSNLFERIDFQSQRRYNIYNPNFYYFVKNTSRNISTPIALGTTSQGTGSGTETPIFYFYTKYEYGTNFYACCSLDFDYSSFIKYFPERQMLADAARYRLKMEKIERKYDAKIRDLENKIQALKDEKELAVGNYNYDEIDNRLFEFFDEGKAQAQRLYEVLKG